MIGKLLRERREAKGFTQKQIAEYLKLSPNYISDIECCRRDIADHYRVMLWATYLGISSADLLAFYREERGVVEDGE